MVGVAQRPAVARDDRAELRLAVEQRQAGQVLAVEFEEIERDIGDRLRRTFQRALERLEAGSPVSVEHDRLPIEEGRTDLQEGSGFDDAAEAVGPIEAGAGKGSRLPRPDGNHDAVAIVFELVQPGVACRHRVDESGELHGPKRRRPKLRDPALLRSSARFGCSTFHRRRFSTCWQIGVLSLAQSGSQARRPSPRFELA